MTGRTRVAMVWTAAATGLVTAIALLASLEPGDAQRYTQRVYPALTRVLVPLGATLPGSTTWVVAVLVLGAWAAAGWRRGPVRAVGLAALLVLATVLWGLAVWGVHYQRAPVAERIGLAPTATRAEMQTLRRSLLATVAATVPADPLEPSDVDAATASIARALGALVRDLEGWDLTLPESVVVLPAGSLLTFGTSGIVSPWWLEAHVDGGLPPTARIAVAAHELAHLAGWAREDEAEAWGALAALRAGDSHARYAAALFQIAKLGASLPGTEREALLAALPERARIDLAETAAAAARYGHPWITRLSRRIYDRYLRTQGVREGLSSYSKATDLLARLLATVP